MEHLTCYLQYLGNIRLQYVSSWHQRDIQSLIRKMKKFQDLILLLMKNHLSFMPEQNPREEKFLQMVGEYLGLLLLEDHLKTQYQMHMLRQKKYIGILNTAEPILEKKAYLICDLITSSSVTIHDIWTSNLSWGMFFAIDLEYAKEMV